MKIEKQTLCEFILQLEKDTEAKEDLITQQVSTYNLIQSEKDSLIRFYNTTFFAFDQYLYMTVTGRKRTYLRSSLLFAFKEALQGCSERIEAELLSSLERGHKLHIERLIRQYEKEEAFELCQALTNALAKMEKSYKWLRKELITNNQF
ncbi:MAG TPA: hypothetical protein VNW06_02435 [Cytophagaceae bacterium]|jgi:hypothetical protein|nr:hypothetical protein [Cytophagaceae bacterium]